MKNRVAALVGEVQAKENRVISAAEIARDTKLTRAVISKWINNDIVSYRSDMIKKLCEYFTEKLEKPIGVGELLYLEGLEDSELTH